MKYLVKAWSAPHLTGANAAQAFGNKLTEWSAETGGRVVEVINRGMEDGLWAVFEIPESPDPS